jgi:hypothetical protein
MRFELKNVFNSIKDYLSNEVPELGAVVTQVVDLYTVGKNTTIMLPYKTNESGGKITFSIIMYTAIVEKKENIYLTQIEAMDNLFNAVYSGNIPAMGAGISSIDCIEPIPQSPNVGLLITEISLLIDQLDDCI